jgi:hypothetical protein
VVVTDAYGNRIATDSSVVTLTLTGGAFSTGLATATAQAVNGIATFNNLIINNPGVYKMTASDGRLATSVSAAFDIAGPTANIISAQINGDNPNELFTAPGQPAPGAQRSMVEDIVYTFSAPVTISNANSAFTVAGTGAFAGTAPSTLTAAAVPGSLGTQWAVTLTGRAPGVLASIANGTYRITVNPSFIVAASDGVTPLSAGRTDNFFRLFGDANGDGVVTNGDLNGFRKAFAAAAGVYNPIFDINDDQTISNADLNQMRLDFLVNYLG